MAASQGLAAHELPAVTRLSLARQAMAQTWPGFAVIKGSDRPRAPLVVVDYDPAWPQAYERWRQRIAAALGRTALRIEHVGSASVPGLAAKPVVDIQVSVADPDGEPRYVPPLQAIGLVLRSRDELHRFLRPPAGQPAHDLGAADGAVQDALVEDAPELGGVRSVEDGLAGQAGGYLLV